MMSTGSLSSQMFSSDSRILHYQCHVTSGPNATLGVVPLSYFLRGRRLGTTKKEMNKPSMFF